MNALELGRTTPDKRLAHLMNAAVVPFEPLLRNAQHAGLAGAEHALETTIFWNAEKAYWIYARGEEAARFQNAYGIENPGQWHIFDAAWRWAFELSGANGYIPSFTSPPQFGTEIRSARFGTNLTPQYRGFPKGSQTDNLIQDIYKIFGASDHQEITSSKDREQGITVFKNKTNVGGTLYDVSNNRDVRLYAKRIRKRNPPTTSLATSPDGHAIRLVSSDVLAHDMAVVENPFQLMRLNAVLAGRTDIVNILNSTAFWHSERAYWMAIRSDRMRPHYDIRYAILSSKPWYVHGVSHAVASELSGIDGRQYDEYGNLTRSEEYGTLLTGYGFPWIAYDHPDYRKKLPIDHPQVTERLQTIYMLLGITESDKKDSTIDKDRLNGNTVLVSKTNLGLICTEIQNSKTGTVNLYVMKV